MGLRSSPEGETEAAGGEEAGAAPADRDTQAALADRLVTQARRTSSEVVMLTDPALLEAVGGVAATLRYRLDVQSGDARQAGGAKA
jgi:hypothetical protein